MAYNIKEKVFNVIYGNPIPSSAEGGTINKIIFNQILFCDN
jgi:hypothetical protein